MKRISKYGYSLRKIIFPLIIVAVFFISFVTYIFTRNAIIRFYSFLIFSTLISLIILLSLIVFAYSLIKSIISKDGEFWVIPTLIFAFFSILFTYITVKYYMDIPYVIKGQYSFIVGECTYSYAYRGRAAHLDTTIGGINFDVSLGYNEFIKKGETYRVEYLPNTKEVMHIYGKINR